MSYAAVVAENAEPASQQPHPNPALLNTNPPTHSNVVDGSLKVNIVGPDFKEHLRPTASETKVDDTVEDEQIYPALPKHTPDKSMEKDTKDTGEKNNVFRPVVAGGLVGIVNIGVFAAIGRTFYTQPELRQNFIAISSAVATSIALLSVEGYIAGSYRKTLCGQEGKGSRGKGASIYRRLEQITRPQALGVLAGIMNVAILGGVGYLASTSWKEKWDWRVVSAISIGLLTVAGGEGILAEQLRRSL